MADPLTLPELTLGCAPIGNLGRAIDDATAFATLEAAWDAGIRRFDTAPHYGLGLSERRLGTFLAGKPRETFRVSTKVGRILVPDDRGGDDDQGFAVRRTHRRVLDYSADGVRQSLRSSLERLQLDRVDTVYLHDPDEQPTVAVAEGWPALAELRARGEVDDIGAGTKSLAALTWLVEVADPDRLMVAGRYTLLDQSAAGLLAQCHEAGVGIDNAAVFNSGILARPDVPNDARFEYAQASTAMLERARTIAGICARFGVSLPEAAIAFAAAPAAVKSVVIGAGSAEQVAQLDDRWSARVPPGLWDALSDQGLIPTSSRPDSPQTDRRTS